MSRKIYVKVRVKTLVPVVTEVDLIVRADSDANIEWAIKSYLKGKPYGKADVEDVGGHEVVEINGTEPPADDYSEASEHLPYAVDELVEAHKGTLVSFVVEDSK